MRERPILMSASMVLACLRDSEAKTNTRRTLKNPPNKVGGEPHYIMHEGALLVAFGPGPGPQTAPARWWKCPYGAPGDRLWVKETYRLPAWADHMRPSLASGNRVYYAADGQDHERSVAGKLRPSIHMPRWACRLVLEVTDVKVERLHDISEADALAEGVQQIGLYYGVPDVSATWDRECHSPAAAYRELWKAINGQDSWKPNPWVWSVHFRRVQP